ncbi:T9SS type A sorting domain-containing protein [Sanyastnella coralliicola]|uniref:T9SS type A sorting domain-containing protein n=1 Tax=Sanyastnella coralliicola TaxID=3069118 RepID=UPI0027B8B4BB|nr:T9SS type A sorting domain-containing protein [Longitalea sp. SCSIO 12813]
MRKSVLSKFINPTNLAVLLITITALVFMGFRTEPGNFHSNGSHMMMQMAGLTTTSGTFFTGSGNCVNCHGTDPNGVALVTEDGEDVAPVNDWQATLMANSAHDPFWRAKVRHEILESPAIAEEIENVCTDCHAPQGHSEFHMTGQGTHYSMEYLLTDSLGLDGVGCIACHGIEDEGLRDSHNGNQPYSELQVAYGTFDNPWSGPMIQQTGFSPAEGQHMGQSEVCAGCHSLFVETVDYDGVATGDTFFEQATYHEWLNSIYDEQEIECQGCHMPDAGDVKMSPTPNWLFPRPFQKHYFVGGNSFMLGLIRDNAEALGVSASTEQFDMVIERTLDALQNQSLTMNVEHIGNEQDSALIEVSLLNEVGHKFPSGYPARLLFLEFKVTDEDGNVLFHNGIIDENYEIVDRDEGYEPHYDIIRNEEDVMIYEMVQADVNDQPTTVLERAKYPLKDNRLTPVGFSQSHISYDTTTVAGFALNDPNFNALEGLEGSGGDRVQYRVPIDGYVGPIQIEARAWYQSLPPQWTEEMFAWDDPEIQGFREMFEERDNTPVLVAEVIQDSTTDIDEADALRNVEIGPNPTTTGLVRFYGLPQGAHQIDIYTQTGQLVFSDYSTAQEITLPSAAGCYVLVVDGVKSFRVVKE